MSIESSITVVGPGPSNTAVFTVDSQGVRDGSGRQAVFFKSIHREMLATSVDNFVWTCREGVWQVQYVSVAIQTAGGSGAQVDVKVSGQTAVAVASGTSVLAAVIPLTVAGPSMAFGTMATTPVNINPGDSIGLDYSGTLTALIANITLVLKRVG